MLGWMASSPQNYIPTNFNLSFTAALDFIKINLKISERCICGKLNSYCRIIKTVNEQHKFQRQPNFIKWIELCFLHFFASIYNIIRKVAGVYVCMCVRVFENNTAEMAWLDTCLPYACFHWRYTLPSSSICNEFSVCCVMAYRSVDFECGSLHFVVIMFNWKFVLPTCYNNTTNLTTIWTNLSLHSYFEWTDRSSNPRLDWIIL